MAEDPARLASGCGTASSLRVSRGERCDVQWAMPRCACVRRYVHASLDCDIPELPCPARCGAPITHQRWCRNYVPVCWYCDKKAERENEKGCWSLRCVLSPTATISTGRHQHQSLCTNEIMPPCHQITSAGKGRAGRCRCKAPSPP